MYLLHKSLPILVICLRSVPKGLISETTLPRLPLPTGFLGIFFESRKTIMWEEGSGREDLSFYFS